MTHQILEKLFGGAARVKIMKLFLFNPEMIFDKSDILHRAKITSSHFTKEMRLLSDIGMVKKKNFSKEGKKVAGFHLDLNFGFLKNLQTLLINNEPLQHSDIMRRIGKTGKIKLIVVSGVFIQNDDVRLDLLVVGDEMKDRAFKTVVATMESEIGKELRYSNLSTEDFKYRYNIGDRLVRDVLDAPHEVIVDRIGL
jgi:hypothetical protein